jgi:hypothetical protein
MQLTDARSCVLSVHASMGPPEAARRRVRDGHEEEGYEGQSV